MDAGWPQAAERLAAAVTRRARVGAFLLHAGAALGVGAATALLAGRLAPAPVPLAVLVLSAAAALALGARRAARVNAAAPGAAAWALDRLAGAEEGGLTAALLPAVATSPPPPPAVTLRPPAGLSVAAGGALLAALVLALGAREDAAPATAQAPGGQADVQRALGAVAGPDGAAQDGAHANSAETQRRAVEADRVRTALGLARAAAEDARAVAERLSDPRTRAAAHAAADADGALARALAQGESAADEVARRLAAAAEAGRELVAVRRAALAGALGAGPAAAPPGRAALVERYVAARAAQGAR